jgi:UDP:flavonoid glycosyltransferase YjiC (YdhE family)
MTKYLLCTWEGGGVIPPELGLAKRLIARGHQVRVLACPAVEEAARAAGCEFSPWVTAPKKHSLAPEEDLMRDWEFKNIFKLFAHILDVFVCGPAGKFAADTLAVLKEHPADVVLTDFIMLGAQIAAEKAGLPCAVLQPNINMRPVAGVPALGPGLMPAKGPFGRLRDRVMTGMGNRLWRKGLPAFNAARAELGLGALRDIWEQYDRATRVFVMTSKELDFLPPSGVAGLPPNMTYMGAVLDDPMWAGDAWSPPWPAENQDPIVLVGLSSTYQEQQAAMGRVVEALSGMKVRALVTLGPALASVGTEVKVTSPNVVVVKTAPHGLVLPHCAAVITHCGHGTTIRSLAAGVPLVCMPMGRDQNDTAARVVARGAGVRIKPTAGPAAIRKALETVLGDVRYAERARALRDAIAREQREIDQVALLEALAGPSRQVAVDRAS